MPTSGRRRPRFTVTGSATSALRFTRQRADRHRGIRIDNVSLVAGFTAPVPANDGTNFASTFTEDGPAVAIASNAAITDPVQTDDPVGADPPDQCPGARRAVDRRRAAGRDHVDASTRSVPGQITINLTGCGERWPHIRPRSRRCASPTRRTIRASTPRNIEVTVTNSDGPSPVAIATVNVVSVNDAPVTVADAIVTNVSSGNIVIPEWVLLANDSDPEGLAARHHRGVRRGRVDRPVAARPTRARSP